MSATYHGQLRKLAEKQGVYFAVTTVGHLWKIKFDDKRVHHLYLQDALKQMVELVTNRKTS